MADILQLDGGGGGNSFLPKGSSNQFISNMPSLPQVAPGIVPPSIASPIFGVGGSKPFSTDIGGGFRTFSTLDPSLTSGLEQFLSDQLGQGATPFNLSALLPSGGVTQPGTLTAPLNNIMQLLQQFYATGQGGPPGLSSLAEAAKTGLPTDVGPAFEAMKAAAQRTIGEGAANLREQFSFGGNLAGSPFGSAMADFQAQTAKDLNAQLIQASTQAQEAAAGRRLTAADILTKDSTSFAQSLQSLDQQAITSLLSEFIRTRPEYGPLLNMIFAMGTSFPPFANRSFGVGVGGALLQNAGTIGSGVASIISALKGPQAPSPTPTGGTPPFIP